MFNKFSIVIIAYNNPNELSISLESLNHIAYPKEHFEVIIVDDGSTNKLKNEVNTAFNYHHEFHYIERTTSSSRSKARNTGANHAKNDWIIFIDGDQYINQHLLDNYNNYLNANQHQQVVLGTRIDLSIWQSKLLLESRNINTLNKLIRNQADNRLHLKEILKNKLLTAPGIWTLFWSHNFAIKNNLFHEIGGFDPDFIKWGFEDVELGYRLTKAGYTYEILENNVFHFYEEARFNQEKHFHWIKNLEFFYKKHNDIAIMCQWFFYDSLAQYNNINKPTPKELMEIFIKFSAKIEFLEFMSSKN